MDQALNITAVVQNREYADTLHKVLDNFYADMKVHIGELAQFAPSMRAGDAPDILIVEVSLEKSDEIELLAQIVGSLGTRTAVIATAGSADLGGIRSLMRIGVVDFLPQPFTKADIFGAIESATSALKHGGRRSGKTGKLLSFIRSCGGAGSTTLAVQTALDFTGQGKTGHSVSLIDLDLQYGNAGLLLDLPDNSGLSLILEAPSRLDRSLLRASMVQHESGLHVLTAPDDIVPLNALSSDAANRTLSLARSEYEYVICDLPHAWTNWTASVLRASDRIVLVTELSVPSLHRTKRIMNLLAEQGLGEIPVSILANKVETGWGSGSRRKRAEEALGRNFDFIIRNDAKTAGEARDRGVPLRQISTRSAIVKDVSAMSENLKNAFEMPAENATATND